MHSLICIALHLFPLYRVAAVYSWTVPLHPSMHLHVWDAYETLENIQTVNTL